MSDLTILYYTANKIPDGAAEKIRAHQKKLFENKYPIISVSQKPIEYGTNICVGEIGRSKYNCYKQILIGVREIKTKYVACAEDDALYSNDHYNFRPIKDDVFYYERNYWLAEEYRYYWRPDDVSVRMGMWGCITTSENLLHNLTKRYSDYPVEPERNKFLMWREPGIHDNTFGIKSTHDTFESKDPTVVFRYRGSMGGLRQYRSVTHSPQNVAYNLKDFGAISKLWGKYWT